MPGRSATLTVKIVSDAKGAAQGFDDAESRIGRFQSGLDKASVAAAGVLGGLGLLGKAAFDSASDLQQATGAMEAVFGDSAGQMRKLAADAAQSVGLAQSEYASNAAVLGSQLKNMGVSAQELAPTTDALISKGADLAAQFGGSTSDAVEALSSLLRGERDPIERYGISVSQAGIDAQVGAMGLDTSTEAARKNAELQAALALVTDQSASSQGAFARESDTAAGAQQRASAQFENAKAALGDVLLPIVAEAMGMFQELTGFLVEHRDIVLPLVAVIGGLAAAIIVVNAAISAYRTILIISTALQWAFNAAILANPMVWVVVAIMAVIAAVILMYNKFQWFRDFVAGVGEFLGSVFDAFQAAIEWVVDKLSWIGDAAGWVGDLFSAPQTMAVTPIAAGSAAGLFGAATGVPVFGAAMSPGSGGTSPSAGPGSGGAVVVNVTVNGALDPVSVGRQIDQVLRKYAASTGRSLSASLA